MVVRLWIIGMRGGFGGEGWVRPVLVEVGDGVAWVRTHGSVFCWAGWLSALLYSSGGQTFGELVLGISDA